MCLEHFTSSQSFKNTSVDTLQLHVCMKLHTHGVNEIVYVCVLFMTAATLILVPPPKGQRAKQGSKEHNAKSGFDIKQSLTHRNNQL